MDFDEDRLILYPDYALEMRKRIKACNSLLMIILGVMDKKQAVFQTFSSSGQKVGCIFSAFIKVQISYFIFTLSSETEASSAGEQLVEGQFVNDKNVIQRAFNMKAL